MTKKFNPSALKISIFIVIILVLGGVVTGQFSELLGTISPASAYQVSCKVPIYNPLGADPAIDKDNIGCATKPVRLCLMSIGGFIFGESKGKVMMRIGESTTSKAYSVPELTGKPNAEEITLTIRCLSKGTLPVEIVLFDDIGLLLDQKTFNLEVGGSQ